MHLDSLSILNYKGIRALEVPEIGYFTLISGGNGEGKSSIFSAIRSVSQSGKEPNSIHKDAEEALIRIELSLEEGDYPAQEAGKYRIQRKIKPDGYSNDVYLLGGKKPKEVKQPGAYIDFVFPEKVLDPAAFARMESSDAAQELKSLLTVPVTAEALRGAAGLFQLNALDPEYADGIAKVKELDGAIRAARTELNSTVKTLEGNIQTFSANLDLSTPEDVASQLKAARTKVVDLDGELRIAIDAAGTAKDTADAAASEAYKERAKEIDNWYQLELEKLQKTRDESLRVEALKEADLKSTAAKTKEVTIEALSDVRDALSAAKQTVTNLEDKDRQAAETAGKRKQLGEWEKDVTAKRRESEKMTLAIEGLATLERKLMAELQIEGYEIRKGELFYDGVLWDNVNHAKRTILSVGVATLFQTKGQPIILDFYESLDAASQAEFEDAVFDAKIQVIAFEVTKTPKPLTIETFHKPRILAAPK